MRNEKKVKQRIVRHKVNKCLSMRRMYACGVYGCLYVYYICLYICVYQCMCWVYLRERNEDTPLKDMDVVDAGGAMTESGAPSEKWSLGGGSLGDTPAPAPAPGMGSVQEERRGEREV